MNLRSFLAVTLVGLIISVPAHAEPDPDILIGTVKILDPAKLNNKTKKELADIAKKIKKNRPNGTVKIIGDIPSAESQDEYISKAVFIARAVVAQLRLLLSEKYQVFITASKYSGEKKPGQNSVEIRLYPYELKVEVAGSNSVQTTFSDLSAELEPVNEQSAQPVYQQSPQSGLLTPAPAEDDLVEITSKKERLQKETENPALANELVIRAKARAAKKARLLEQTN